jgi:hypothetical protein
MTTRLLILLAAALLYWAAPAQGQTIKSFGYNTTNGQVVYGGTNDLTFTNSVSAPQFFVKIGTNIFLSIAEDVAEFLVPIDVRSSNGMSFSATNSAAATRTNLSLGATWLTNANVTNFRSAIGLGILDSVQFSNATVSTLLEVRTLFVNDSTNQTRIQFEEPANAKTFVRNLTGSTNTNAPFSGEFRFEDPDTSTFYVATVSNGIILFINEY